MSAANPCALLVCKARKLKFELTNFELTHSNDSVLLSLGQDSGGQARCHHQGPLQRLRARGGAWP